MHHDYDDKLQEDEDLVTPHTRRCSFLLDVINSTTRSRMKFPTSIPHPRKFWTRRISSSSLANDISVFSWNTWIRSFLHFWWKSYAMGYLCSHLTLWRYTADHASFISTDSSHDLTTHHRVNTSLDPAWVLELVPRDMEWVDSTLLNWIITCIARIDNFNKKKRISLRV